MHRDCRGMGYGEPPKCNYRALGRTGGTSTVWQMGGGKQGEHPICLLGGHGACNEIVPGDVPCLGNKTCLTFLRDQSTAATHRQIGSEFVSKLQVSWQVHIPHQLVLRPRMCTYTQGLGGAADPVAVWSANGWQGGTLIQAIPTCRRDLHTNFAAKTKLKVGGGSRLPWLSWLGLLSRGSTMCTLGGAQSTAYPTGKSYAIGRFLGLRTHVTASADDPCTTGL